VSAPPVPSKVDAALECVVLGDVPRALAFLASPSGRAGDEGWRRVGKGDGPLRIYYGRCDTHHAIRCVAPFPTSVVAVVASVRELDLMPTWNPYTPHALIVKDWSPRHVSAVAQVWTPRPFPGARVMLDAQLFDALDEHGCYVITAKPPAERPLEIALPRCLRNLLELSVRVVATAKPVPAEAAGGGGAAADACESELVVFLPASLIPAWLLTFALYVGFPLVYRAAVKMLRAATADGSALEARMRCGPQAALYADLRARCEAHVQRGRMVAPRVDREGDDAVTS
jgi:hypothetical protein